MTNTTIKKYSFITPERSAIFLPTIISSFIAVILLITFSIPKYVSSNKVNNELKEFKRKTNELPNLKIQSKQISEKLIILNIQKSKIIELISGTNNLKTFISRLGFLAEKNNIEFESIRPLSSTKFVNSKSSSIQNELNIIPDQFLVEGVKKYNIDLNLKASYKDLLSFLRDLELQENMIIFEDINLQLKESSELEDSKNNINNIEVNLKIAVYGKI
tara:strand:+ start:405 stop:1055 length:651 start_codon:yes stop_codon:yes gene_type:complete